MKSSRYFISFIVSEHENRTLFYYIVCMYNFNKFYVRNYFRDGQVNFCYCIGHDKTWHTSSARRLHKFIRQLGPYINKRVYSKFLFRKKSEAKNVAII